MDTFTEAYIDCALFASNDESDPETGGDPMDANYGPDDLAPETLAAMLSDCDTFQEQNGERIDGNATRAGHDFWLTRNGHGAGFWDGDWPEHGDALTTASEGFGEVSLYIGDDGLIYQA